MQLTTIIALATTLAVTTAAPATRRANDVSITFKGAADASYKILFPADDAYHATNDALSISSVYSKDINVAQNCVLQTVNHPPVLVPISADEWNVGPPQTVTHVKCRAGGPVPRANDVVHVEFQGADPSKGAKYGLDVNLDGTVVYTKNKLSISTIVTTYQDLPGCSIKYADHPALSKIAADTWAVGPPQWIESISCKN